MTEIKYTKDGKKVVVIGKLNSEESIVQEVFVTESGDQIPAGENFVERGLLDEPAISWNEWELDRLKKQVEREKLTLNSQKYNLEAQNKLLKKLIKTLSNKVNWLNSHLDELTNETLSLMVDYISGNIKYIVTTGYYLNITPIAEWDEEYGEQGSLSLISIYGSRGGFNFTRHSYSDGSGSKVNFVPCRTYEDAISVIQKKIDSLEEYYHYHIKAFDKYPELVPDEKKLKKYNNDAKESAIKNINKLKKELKDAKARLKKYEN